MSQKICPNCSAQNRPGARFCNRCGTGLELPPTQVAQTPGFNSALGTGLLPPQAHLADRYIIIKRVGQGGMGAVYQALDTRISNQVWAIKEMSDAALTTPLEKQQALSAFKREADLLAQLKHPNLPRVTDRFAVNDKHYLVMEFIKGRTLEERILGGEGPFAETDVVTWAKQLCDVIGYLHTQNPPIIFRDLKPGNIMVGGDGRVKLIDFGIVRFFKAGKAKDTMLLGTPGYAPPEQYGTGQTDARSDVYSLGATLFHLLTGRDPADYPPYQIPTPRQANGIISVALSEAIAKAMHPTPAKRWQSMAEFKQALSTLTPQQKRQSQRLSPPLPTQAVNPAGTSQRTSRPTTLLLLQATQRFSERQLATVGIGLLALIILGTFFLTPLLRQFTLFWNNVPTLAIVGPLAYTAIRRRGVMGVAQFITALLGGGVVFIQIGGDFISLLAGAFVSALVMEVMVNLLPIITGRKDPHASGVWLREVIWLGIIAIAGTITLSTLAAISVFARNPIAWVAAGVLGMIGWFIGDLIYSYNDIRRSARWKS